MAIMRGAAGEKVLKAAGLRFSAAVNKSDRLIVADLNRAVVEEDFAREAMPAVMAVTGVTAASRLVEIIVSESSH